MSTLANVAREAAGSVAAAALIAGAAASSEPAPAPAPASAPAPAAAAPTPPAVTLEAFDLAAVRAEARTAERGRIKAIIGHPEAEGRMSLAHKLAFTTDMTPEAAAEFLAGEPKAEAAPARTLTGATVPQPNVKPQAAATEVGDAKARLAAAVKSVTGQKA